MMRTLRVFMEKVEDKPNLLFGVTCLYMLLIIYLSTIPYFTQPEAMHGLKEAPIIEHIIEFGFLGFLLFALFNSLQRGEEAYVMAIFVGVFYGVFSEVLQFYVPGRFATVEDILINCVGVFLGVFLMSSIRKSICNGGGG